MSVKVLTVVFLMAAATGFAALAYLRDGEDAAGSSRQLTPEDIRRLYPCVYYPGQASGPGTVKLLAYYADAVVIARVEGFEFGGFDQPDISWTVVLRTVRTLKGEGEPACRLAIASPERNFGPSAEGRLFLLFIRRSKDDFRWTLEPWLPENEDIASGV